VFKNKSKHLARWTVGFVRKNQILLTGLLLVFAKKSDNEATQRCQKTIKIPFPPLSADIREMRKLVCDGIAVLASTDIHISP
jgi:hypothetical protein